MTHHFVIGRHYMYSDISGFVKDLVKLRTVKLPWQRWKFSRLKWPFHLLIPGNPTPPIRLLIPRNPTPPIHASIS